MPGRPSYTLRKLIYLALDGLVSFSHMPLHHHAAGFYRLSAVLPRGAVLSDQETHHRGRVAGFTTLVVSIFLPPRGNS